MAGAKASRSALGASRGLPRRVLGSCRLIFVNYLSGKETVLSPLLAAIVGSITGYVSPSGLARRLVGASWDWGASARFFHFATQQVPYETNPEEGRARLADHARQVAPPSPYLDLTRRATPLPGSFAEEADEFWDVLRRRGMPIMCRPRRGPYNPTSSTVGPGGSSGEIRRMQTGARLRRTGLDPHGPLQRVGVLQRLAPSVN